MTHICRRCGDRRLPPPHDWAGERDRFPGSPETIPGGLGPCGDLHDWVLVERRLSPRADAVRRVAVWGRGPAAARLVRDGEATEVAVGTAARFGFHLQTVDDWAVEVEASETEVDAATRNDPAVLGWAPLLVRPAPEVDEGEEVGHA